MKNPNYYDVFIEVAEDCPVQIAEVPQYKGAKKSMPALQFEMIHNHPYEYRQEDVLFETFARRKEIPEANQIPEANRAAEREKFFSKGQP